MKIFLGLFISFCTLISFQVLSLEKGKWSFVKTDDYCYVGSLATETDLSPEKNRGEFYILVYKNIGNPETVVQIEAGYDYKIEKDIIVNNFKVNNKGTVKAQFKNKVILAEFIQIKNHYLVYLCKKKTNL